MFWKGFKKKFSGGDDRYEEEKKFSPMEKEQGDEPVKGDMLPPAKNEEGGDDEKKEMKPESDKDEGNEEEAIEEILDLFDQLTPLIEKLRNRK